MAASTPSHPTERDLAIARVHVLEMVLRGVPLEPTLAEMTTLLGDLHPRAQFGVSLVDLPGGRFASSIFPGLTPSFSAAVEGLPIGPPYMGTCGEAVRRGVTVTSRDILRETRFHADWRYTCLAHGIRAMQSRPVFGRDGVALGSFVTCFGTPQPARPGFDDLIKVGAGLTALVVEHDRRRTRREGANDL